VKQALPFLCKFSLVSFLRAVVGSCLVPVDRWAYFVGFDLWTFQGPWITWAPSGGRSRVLDGVGVRLPSNPVADGRFLSGHTHVRWTNFSR
jgi:hypothetical protein